MTDPVPVPNAAGRTEAGAAPRPARSSWIVRLLREPLLHFLLLGAGLFALHAYFQSKPQAKSEQIVVSAGKIEHLAALFAKTWQRPPTTQELAGLIDDHVREEVAYREGLKFGLDQDDTIIRRRIRQKLDFFAEDLATLREPTEGELSEFLANHADAYRADSRLTFRQLFFDPAQHGPGLDQEIATLLTTLPVEPAADVAERGDRTLLEHRYQEVPAREVAGTFGEPFAAELERLPLQRWQGPLASPYGTHAVIVDSREPGRVPALADVRDSVRRDWEHQQRKELAEQFYQGLLGKYQVQIEWPTAADARE